MALKNIKEKEPMVNEKINLDSTRIDKLEGIITNLGTAFSSVKNTPNPPTKIAKLMYVPKNKGESSSKETAIIKEPFAANNFFFDFVPRSLIINRKKETPKGDRCLIEEFPTKEGNT